MASPRLRARRVLTVVAFMIGFGAVLSRLVTLQVLQAEDLSVKADRQHKRVVTVEGTRGKILDRNGKVLAMNADVPSVYAMPRQLENPSRVARDVARILHQPRSRIAKKLLRKRNFVWIARKVDPEQGPALRRLSGHGIGILMEGRRYYPKGPLLGHLLGFAGMDNQGLEGLELRYDAFLRGKKQVFELHRDALGRTVLQRRTTAGMTGDGHDVTLTIDEVVQYIAELELETAVMQTRAKGGTIIVMEPRTGAVLAMAVNPRYDPNSVRGLSPHRWRNRAVTDVYEPGSTMKIVLAASALEEQVLRPSTEVFCENGQMVVAGTIIHDHHELGWLTFSEVIQRSSNIGSVKVAMDVGEERLYRYFRAFGFGDRTEIDLPGETAGLVKAPKDWGRRSLASMAIGQEMAVTSIQLVTAVAAVANGGWLMKPYVVSEVRDAKGTLVYQATPQVRRRPVSPDTIRALNRILKNAVLNGTGRRAALPGYRVAGKTGTAQKIDPATRAYSPTQFVASFVGYVPVDDPQLAILVVIDEPETASWGGVVAAPVFRRVAEQVLPYLGVPARESVRLAAAEL